MTEITPKSNKPKLSKLSRIQRSLHKNWAALTWPSHGHKVIRKQDLLWVINRKHAIDRSFGIFGSFEDMQMKFLFSQMKEKEYDTFIDIGANFGLYSLCCAKAKAAGDIYAFEPDPRNFAQMQGNLYLNKLTETVKLQPLAMSDKETELEFSLFSGDCAGITKVVEKEDKQRSKALGKLKHETRTLKASSLDMLFPWQDKKPALKIDVEGHEQATIRGGEKLLRYNDCLLQVEIWPEHFDVIMGQLADIGYEPFHQIDVDYYFRKK